MESHIIAHLIVGNFDWTSKKIWKMSESDPTGQLKINPEHLSSWYRQGQKVNSTVNRSNHESTVITNHSWDETDSIRIYTGKVLERTRTGPTRNDVTFMHVLMKFHECKFYGTRKRSDNFGREEKNQKRIKMNEGLQFEIKCFKYKTGHKFNTLRMNRWPRKFPEIFK